MQLAKWSYYARSIPLMISGFSNWTSLPLALSTGRGRVVRLRDLTFFYRDAMDVWTIKETCLDDHYRLAGRRVREGGVIIDIGAGLGDFAIAAARQHPHTRVLAFEPFPASAALCRRNVQLNRTENVEVVESAVGRNRGAIGLDISSPESVQYSTASGLADSSALRVPTEGLGEMFAERGIARCDLLKLDCEGAEFEILLTLDRAILDRIDSISMEYHDGVTAASHADLVAALSQAGFTVSRVQNPVHANLGYIHADRKID
ncbi:FkbM family methyltransferase [Chloroflexales bacterium ZM16-3]|nr:FkbM family methyltransferase [Chloroflexales bacterium ZM16-3]